MEARTNPSTQDPSVKASLATYVGIVCQSHSKLVQDLIELQTRFDTMKSEGKTLENTQKYVMPAALIVFGALTALTYFLFLISKTDRGELSSLKANQVFGLLALAVFVSRFYLTDPKDRTFRMYEWASHLIKNNYKEMNSEYENMVDSLNFYVKNLKSLYCGNAENEKKLGLIFTCLEEEKKLLAFENKPNMTINKMEALMQRLDKIMEQSRYEIEHTDGYSPGMFSDNHSLRRFENQKRMTDVDDQLLKIANMV